MHRWTPGIVASLTPVVPSAQPSQTPSVRTRYAYGSWSRFSQAMRAMSRKWRGFTVSSPNGTSEAQERGSGIGGI
jgi:hypothetical protein